MMRGRKILPTLNKKLDSNWKNVRIEYKLDYVGGNNDRSSSSKLASHGHKPAKGKGYPERNHATYPFTKSMGTYPSE